MYTLKVSLAVFLFAMLYAGVSSSRSGVDIWDTSSRKAKELANEFVSLLKESGDSRLSNPVLDEIIEIGTLMTKETIYYAELRFCDTGGEEDRCDVDCSELSLDDDDLSCGGSGSSCLRSKRSLSGFFKGIETANRLKRSGSKMCCEICTMNACCSSNGNLKLSEVKCCPDN